MKFKVISVRGTSVRIRSGFYTIDVTVYQDDNGKYWIDKPDLVFIAQEHIKEFKDTVVSAYTENIISGVTENAKTEKISCSV